MNIIIPMAGRGTRLRPHTLVTPKPLVQIAGKPIVEWLVKDLIAICPEKVENIGFIIGDFGYEVEQQLLNIADSLGAKGHIFHQEVALGTAHAILCAKTLLQGKTIVAFADTLFRCNQAIDTTKDGVIFVQKVEDPKAFGVVKLGSDGHITDFVEKPQTFVSDLAIIGIYYFQDGSYLNSELQYLIDNDIKEKGEYQLTNAMENMKNKGSQFFPGEMQEWLDCGNKQATVYTNLRMLNIKKDELQIPTTINNVNSIIIQPCFIGESVTLENTVIGPNVSIGNNSVIKNSIIENSLIQNNVHITNKVLSEAMIGMYVNLNANAESWSLGDYSSSN